MSAMIEAAGWTLLHFLWQGAIIGALFALLLWSSKRAQVRYLAGCLAMLGMVGAVAATFVHHYQPVVEEVPPAAEPLVEADVVFVPVFDHVFPVQGSCRPCHLIVTETTAQGEVVMFCPPVGVDAGPPPGSSIAESDEAEAAVAAETNEEAGSEFSWLVGVWLAGVLLLSLRLIFFWIVAQGLKRREVTPVDSALVACLHRMAAQVGVRRPVQIVKSAAVAVPTVVGWLRPVILVPAGTLLGLSRGQLEAVLAHELAHIRRHDYLVNLLQHAVEIIFFFHPAVWWVSRKIREEREHCCDDVAVATSGRLLDYAQALAVLEEQRGERIAMAVAADGGSLLARIRRLSGVKPGRNTPLAVLPILVLLGAIAIPVAISSQAPERDSKDSLVPSRSAPAKSALATRDGVLHPLTSAHAVLGLRHLLAKVPETDILFDDFVLLAKALDQAQLVALLDEIGMVRRDGYHPWVRSALYAEWAGRDLEGALAHFGDNFENRRGILQQVSHAIYVGSRPEDPQAALAYLRSIPDDPRFRFELNGKRAPIAQLGFPWVMHAYERVFEELAAHDAELAWMELPRYDGGQDSDNLVSTNPSYHSMLRGFFHGMEDGPTIEHYVKRLGPVQSERLGIGIASAWMEHDLAAAQAWAPLQKSSLSVELLWGVKGNAARTWARGNPKQALQAIQDNLLPEWTDQMADMVLVANPHLAGDLVAALGARPVGNSPTLETFLNQVTEGPAELTPPLTVTVPRRLDDPPTIYGILLNSMRVSASLEEWDYFPEPGRENRPPDYRARYESYRAAITSSEVIPGEYRTTLLGTLDIAFREHLAPEEQDLTRN